MRPLYIINFKTYPEATGKNAVRLAKICDKTAKQKKARIIICLQPADICISKKISIPVFAQHIDPVEAGQTTGYVVAEDVKADGAVGTLLNHSEHKISFDKLKKAVGICRKNKLKIVICASTPAEAFRVSKLKPDYIAIEPPELIGGKISVSEAKPEVITKTTNAVRKIPVLCGAGIHEKEDVIIAVKLGAKGILVASAVVKARNPEKILRNLVIQT
jgi:triosephosphate isomerase